jgi:hypothetical protein
MAAFAFRCPSTRLIVEGWIADDPTGDKSDTCWYLSQIKSFHFFVVTRESGGGLGLASGHCVGKQPTSL